MSSSCGQLAARLMAGVLAVDAGTGPPGPPVDTRAEDVSGVVLPAQTLPRHDTGRWPAAEAVHALGLLPGLAAGTGARPNPDRATEGPGARLARCARLGGAFATWRAVFTITDELPSPAGVRAEALALARFAAACQKAGLVPVVAPEVLAVGAHSLRRCAEVTAWVHAVVTAELAAFDVDPAATVLASSLVTEGADHPEPATPAQVAAATVAVLRRMPATLAGVAVLPGGRAPGRVLAYLAALRAHHTPWQLTSCVDRSLVGPALQPA
jgi:fructose-bisphosphate aldolase class I